LVSDLHTNSPALEILEISDNNWTSAGLLEPTSTAWAALPRLRILRFAKATHRVINTYLGKINASMLEVVELVGAPISEDGTSEISASTAEPPIIELPTRTRWRLRFKKTSLQEVRDTLETIQPLASAVVEIDFMGLLPEEMLNGANSNVTFQNTRKYLEDGWKWILDRVPSVIWVIRKGQEDWVPLNRNRPPSLHEVVEYILGAIAREFA
ncbi:hypothetical protein FRC01_004900, partial [Tulasnella sp. 417]